VKQNRVLIAAVSSYAPPEHS